MYVSIVTLFQPVYALRTLVIGLDGIDVTFKLAAIYQLDDVSSLNQSMWVWLIQQGFSGIVVLNVGQIIIHCDLFIRTFSLACLR